MTHHYNISGMTCSGCQKKVETLLSAVPGVQSVTTDLSKGQATITMSRHIETPTLAAALKDYPKYQLSEPETHTMHAPVVEAEAQASWFSTYKPILLIFGYITGVTFLLEYLAGGFMLERWMAHFMAGFFLVFSFFKLLNLEGFADSYSTYDIIAKRWRGWGYVYAFTELALGLAFLTGWAPLVVNGITLIVMTISIIGVLQSVLNKRKIKCACLGDVFNLPMSTVTIIEDGLMIAMSALMLIMGLVA